MPDPFFSLERGLRSLTEPMSWSAIPQIIKDSYLPPQDDLGRYLRQNFSGAFGQAALVNVKPIFAQGWAQGELGDFRPTLSPASFLRNMTFDAARYFIFGTMGRELSEAQLFEFMSPKDAVIDLGLTFLAGGSSQIVLVDKRGVNAFGTKGNLSLYLNASAGFMASDPSFAAVLRFQF